MHAIIELTQRANASAHLSTAEAEASRGSLMAATSSGSRQSDTD